MAMHNAGNKLQKDGQRETYADQLRRTHSGSGLLKVIKHVALLRRAAWRDGHAASNGRHATVAGLVGEQLLQHLLDTHLPRRHVSDLGLRATVDMRLVGLEELGRRLELAVAWYTEVRVGRLLWLEAR